MVTATMGEFSNPILKNECKFPITWQKEIKRDINLLETNNIIQSVINEINSHPDEKIFVAYNSILQIQNIISTLGEEIRKDCAILCSEASVREAGEYYVTGLQENGTLPNRINFATCCYFTGIDVLDNYHLITVSDSRRDYSMLTIDRMIQIYGRCRSGYKILSDAIIFNTKDYAIVEDMRTYPNSLVRKASKVLKLMSSADDISKDDYTLTNLFAIIKEAIKEKAQEKISSGESINLTRKNIHGEYVPAYLNIDYLVEKMELYRGLYFQSEIMKNALEKYANTIQYNFIHYDTPAQQSTLEDENKAIQKELLDSYTREAIVEIKTLVTTGSLSDTTLQMCIRQSKRNKKVFFERFLRLYKYVDLDSLLCQLWEIRTDNNIAFKNVNNAIMYWALAEEHPLKTDTRAGFNTNIAYSASEIQTILSPIIKYHLHKILKPRKYISLFKAIYATKRPRSKYCIISENPLSLKEQKEIIPKHENNLLKYFML